MDDLFGDEEEEPPTSKPVTTTSSSKKSGGLFSDDDDHEDLFASMTTTERKEEKEEELKKSPKPQKKRPAGAVPMFGGGGNPFNLAAEAAAKRKGKENKGRIINKYLSTLFMATPTLDDLFESSTKSGDKTNDLFSSEPKSPPPMVAKKPTRSPLEDDDKEELPVKPSVSKLQVHVKYMCKIVWSNWSSCHVQYIQWYGIVHTFELMILGSF